jgi:hypothetical protein
LAPHCNAGREGFIIMIEKRATRSQNPLVPEAVQLVVHERHLDDLGVCVRRGVHPVTEAHARVMAIVGGSHASRSSVPTREPGPHGQAHQQYSASHRDHDDHPHRQPLLLRLRSGCHISQRRRRRRRRVRQRIQESCHIKIRTIVKHYRVVPNMRTGIELILTGDGEQNIG